MKGRGGAWLRLHAWSGSCGSSRIVPPQDDDEEIWGDPIFLAVSGVEGGRKEAGRKAGTGKEGRKEGSNFVTAAAAWFEPCSRLDGNMFSCAKELRQSVQTC